jgi:hypothetical protein
MDDTVTRLAKELAQAIRAAVAADPTVEACRAKARAAGYELHLAIDAEVGFANRAKGGTAMVKVRRAGAGAVNVPGSVQPATPPASAPIGSGPLGAAPLGLGTGASSSIPSSGGATGSSGANGPGPRRPPTRELSASDRLFLKSLRIAPDELPEVKG